MEDCCMSRSTTGDGFGRGLGRGPLGHRPALAGPRIDRDCPYGVPGLVRACAERAPEDIALVDAGRALTYRSLDRLSDVLAAQLADATAGIDPSRPVVLCLPRGADLVVAALAVLKAGRPYLPIDPDEPAARMELMGAAADPVAVVSDRPGPAVALRLEHRLQVPREYPADAGVRALPPVTSQTPVYVLFTSGSTGTPKGVVQHSAGLCNRLLWMREEFGDSCARVLQKTPVTFDVSGWEIWVPLVSGGRCVLLPPDLHRDPGEISRWIEQHRITLCHFVPSMLAEFLRVLRPGACASLQDLVCSGEALTPGLAALAVRSLPATLHNLYGPTETAIEVTAWRVPSDITDDAVVPIGAPIDNVDVHVLDDAGEPVPAGEPGELWIGGTPVALGYAGRPELSAAAFRQAGDERCYRTGDRVRVRDGVVEYLGRIDDQVKVRGVRIEPGEVERVLETHPGVGRAVVTVVRPGGRSHELLAALLTRSGPDAAAADDAELRSFLLRRLPTAFVPGLWVRTDEIPLSRSGKTDRRAADRLVLAALDRAPGAAGHPEDPLREVWAAVLGAGADERQGFLEAGGHSLGAIRVLGVVEEHCGVRLPLALLLRDGVSLAELRSRVGRVGGPDRSGPPGDDARAPEPLPGGVMPMPPGLRRLWLLQQLSDRAEAAYHVVKAVELVGAVDPARVQRAVGAAVARYDALRMSVHDAPEGPLIGFAAPEEVHCPVEVVDGSAAYDPAEFVAESSADGMPSSAPMMRVRLRRGPERSCLVVVLSHLVADLRSADLVLDAILADLAEECPGDGDGGGSYRAFAEAEHASVDGPRWQQDLAYWREALSGAPEELDLPMRGPRPPVAGFAARLERRALGPELSARAEQAAADLGVTPAAFFLGCFAALLHSWSGQRELMIGVPVDVRRTPAEQAMVAMGTSTLALRSTLAERTGLGDVVRGCRDAFVAAADHTAVPFDVLVDALGVRSAPGRNPVFQAWFNDLTSEAPPRAVPGTTVVPVATPVLASLFDVGVYLRRGSGGLELTTAGAADLLTQDVVGALADQLLRLVALAVDSPGLPLAELALAGQPPAPGRGPVRAEVTGPDLWRRWEAQAVERPGAPAIVVGDRVLDHAELAAGVDRLDRALRERGAGPGRTVLLWSARDELLPIALLAIWRTGSVLALAPADAPEHHRTACRAAARPDLALCCRPGDVPGDLSVAELLAGAPAAAAVAVADWPLGDRAGHVLFTSGTTGAPAAVRATGQALADAAEHYLDAFQVTARDRFALLSGPAHDPVLRDILMPFSAGAAVCVPPPDLTRSPERLCDWLADSGVTVLHATPGLLELLAAGAGGAGGRGGRLPRLRLIVSGGEALTMGVVRRVRGLTDAAIVNAYGATETPQIAACALVLPEGAAPDPDLPDHWPLPVGRGVAGREVYTATAEGLRLGVGQRGEVVVRGGNLALGYLGDDPRQDRFRPDPEGGAGLRLYRTGDSGFLTEHGEVVVTGRLDRQISVGGYRIEPTGVEAVALEYPGVTAARVGLRDSQAGPVLALAVAGPPDDDRVRDELRSLLRARLPQHAVPGVITIGGPGLDLDSSNKLRSPRPSTADRAVPAAARAVEAPAREYLAALHAMVEEILGNTVPAQQNFFEAGLTSLTLLRLHQELRRRLGIRLPVTDLFARPSIAALAAHLTRLEPPVAERGNPPERQARHALGDSMPSAQAQAQAQAQPGPEPDAADPLREPVAIIGLAGRFPGARDAAEFWSNLRDGVDGMSRPGDEELRALGVSEETLADPAYVRAVPLLPDADRFDAGLFGMTPREALLRDPQQRVFLETAHAALENAGYDPFAVPSRTGVFGGSAANRYVEDHLRHNPALAQVDTMTMDVTNHNDYLPLLASYKLSLDGPSIAVATACSTALVALHLAANALREGSCEVAVAGGVEIEFPFGQGYTWAPGSIYARDGVCRPFDGDASGTVFGSGVGVVVLKLLRQAIADGDTVRAVIRGSAVNNDGSDKVSFSAPSVSGQAKVVRAAMTEAAVRPDQVDYVEAHGTGTVLGDPIEVAALGQAYADLTDRPLRAGSVLLGSVKSNIGHLGPAAGMAGLIKTVLALENEQLPPSINYRRPNPAIDFDATPFTVNDRLSAWPRNPGRPRVAGVSSFGVGGTNAHIIVEEAPAAAVTEDDGRPQLLAWSARTEAPLEAARERLAEYFAGADAEFADAVHTLQLSRTGHPVRAALVSASAAEAAEALRAGDPRVVLRRTGTGGPRRICFAFPGQGSQQVLMGHGLYREVPHFARVLDECFDLFAQHGVDVRPAWRGADPAGIEPTGTAQPLLFAVEYATAQALIAAGVQPEVLLGHSVGELSAAAVAGVLDLPDAVRLVAARGRLMAEMPAGSMLAVGLPERELGDLAAAGLSLAAVNSSDQCVVSGPDDAVRDLADRLRAEGIQCRELRTSHAFHSASMAAAAERFEAEFAHTVLRAPRLRLVSAATGREVTPAEAVAPGFWARQLVQPVRFDLAVDRVLGEAGTLLLEVGPGQALTSLLRRHPAVGGERGAAVPTAPRTAGDQADLRAFLTALGAVYVEGHPLDWPLGSRGRRVPLPAYPYQRERFWMDVAPAAETPAAAAPAVAAQAAVPDSPFGVIGWFEEPLPQEQPEQPAAAARRALVLLPQEPQAGAPILSALHRAGLRVSRVRAGDRLRLGEEDFTVRPDHDEDLAAVLAELRRRGAAPHLLVHAWGVPAWEQAAPSTLDVQLPLGCLSVFALMRHGTVDTVDGALPELVVLTSGAVDVSGTETVHPVKSMALGAVTTLRLEAPGIRCRLIDLGGRFDERLLAADLGAAEAPPVVAWRGARRWLRRETGFTPWPGSGEAVRDEGVYVVTGGLGGLGLEVAKGLARTGTRPRIALLGRRVPGGEPALGAAAAARVEQAVDEMSVLGATVRLIACDVSDADQLKQAWSTVESELGLVNGVVQCAGVAGGGVIQLRDPQEIDRVLRPKVTGALLLEELLGSRPRLDFCVQFSSRSGTRGLIGSGDYAAANAFVDAWSATALPNSRTLSIGWPSWQHVGMAAQDPVEDAPAAGGGQVVWDEEIGAETHWVLDEHRIGGRPVLPGTGQLDLVLRAWSAKHGPGAVRLAEVVFARPVDVPQRRRIQVLVGTAPDDRSGPMVPFTVRSRPAAGGDWTEHTTGLLGEAGAEPAPVDIAALERELAAQTAPPTAAGGGVVAFGPRWGSLGRAVRGARSDLVELSLPAAFHADLSQHVLHPALLDEATASAQRPAEGSRLPFLYRELTVHHPLPARFWSHVRYVSAERGAVVADIDLLSETGQVLVSVSGYTMRAVDRDSFTSEVTGEVTADGPERGAVRRAPRPGAADERNGLDPRTGVELFLQLLSGRTPPHVLVRPYVDGRPLAESGAQSVPVLPALAPVLPGPAGPAAPAAPGVPVVPHPERQAEAVPEPAPAEDSVLAAVRGFWTEALGFEEIAEDDDFFEIGGDSLSAIQLMSRIRDRFGVELSVALLFECPTLALLAQAVSDRKEN
jgi:phthiocerol/phenolphthiocerol synthesis type-I polyketide synthase E